jgi:hypothetical protein
MKKFLAGFELALGSIPDTSIFNDVPEGDASGRIHLGAFSNSAPMYKLAQHSIRPTFI